MINFKFNQLLKKKGILMSILTVCSLLICENALAVWGKKCCQVFCNPLENQIRIDFKFFEYSKDKAKKNSFLEEFEAYYSTDGGQNYTFLLKTTTDNQTAIKWAWIAFKIKNQEEIVDLFYQPYNHEETRTLRWLDGTHPILKVKNHSIFTNETWINLYWLLRENQKKITHIQILGRWIEQGNRINSIPILIYDLNKKKAKLDAGALNFSNSSPQKEIKTKDKSDVVTAYKKTNSIVVKGSKNENIQVYTISGKLLKSIIAE